jgi:hypothetical protein
MAGDIHFFCGYPVIGLKSRGDMDSHFWLKMMVEHIPRKELDELNHFRITPLNRYLASSPIFLRESHLFSLHGSRSRQPEDMNRAGDDLGASTEMARRHRWEQAAGAPPGRAGMGGYAHGCRREQVLAGAHVGLGCPASQMRTRV